MKITQYIILILAIYNRGTEYKVLCRPGEDDKKLHNTVKDEKNEKKQEVASVTKVNNENNVKELVESEKEYTHQGRRTSESERQTEEGKKSKSSAKEDDVKETGEEEGKKGSIYTYMDVDLIDVDNKDLLISESEGNTEYYRIIPMAYRSIKSISLGGRKVWIRSKETNCYEILLFNVPGNNVLLVLKMWDKVYEESYMSIMLNNIVGNMEPSSTFGSLNSSMDRARSGVRDNGMVRTTGGSGSNGMVGSDVASVSGVNGHMNDGERSGSEGGKGTGESTGTVNRADGGGNSISFTTKYIGLFETLYEINREPLRKFNVSEQKIRVKVNIDDEFDKLYYNYWKWTRKITSGEEEKDEEKGDGETNIIYEYEVYEPHEKEVILEIRGDSKIIWTAIKVKNREFGTKRIEIYTVTTSKKVQEKENNTVNGSNTYKNSTIKLIKIQITNNYHHHCMYNSKNQVKWVMIGKEEFEQIYQSSGMDKEEERMYKDNGSELSKDTERGMGRSSSSGEHNGSGIGKSKGVGDNNYGKAEGVHINSRIDELTDMSAITRGKSGSIKTTNLVGDSGKNDNEQSGESVSRSNGDNKSNGYTMGPNDNRYSIYRPGMVINFNDCYEIDISKRDDMFNYKKYTMLDYQIVTMSISRNENYEVKSDTDVIDLTQRNGIFQIYYKQEYINTLYGTNFTINLIKKSDGNHYMEIVNVTRESDMTEEIISVNSTDRRSRTSSTDRAEESKENKEVYNRESVRIGGSNTNSSDGNGTKVVGNSRMGSSSGIEGSNVGTQEMGRKGDTKSNVPDNGEVRNLENKMDSKVDEGSSNVKLGEKKVDNEHGLTKVIGIGSKVEGEIVNGKKGDGRLDVENSSQESGTESYSKLSRNESYREENKGTTERKISVKSDDTDFSFIYITDDIIYNNYYYRKEEKDRTWVQINQYEFDLQLSNKINNINELILRNGDFIGYTYYTSSYRGKYITDLPIEIKLKLDPNYIPKELKEQEIIRNKNGNINENNEITKSRTNYGDKEGSEEGNGEVNGTGEGGHEEGRRGGNDKGDKVRSEQSSKSEVDIYEKYLNKIEEEEREKNIIKNLSSTRKMYMKSNHETISIIGLVIVAMAQMI